MHKINIEYISSEHVDKMANDMKSEDARLLSINGYVDVDRDSKVVYNFEISKENVKTYICRADGEIVSLKDYFGKFVIAYEEEIMEIIPVKFIGVQEKPMFLTEDSNLRRKLFTVPVLWEEENPILK
ncbi:MAG: hypothetical protein FWC47_12740 [Oscillospiraceae bacterium]|nr:hypothetical protein [Oscillospiraceae bacterium]